MTNEILRYAKEIRQLVALCLIVLATPLAHGQLRDSGNVVRLTITTQGLYLSHSKIKGGTVRVLIENRTLLRNPEVQVTDAKSPASARVGKVDAPQAARKNFQDITLPPGSYILSLTVDPKAQVSLEVLP